MATTGTGDPGQSDDTITDEGTPWTDGKAGDDTIVWSSDLGSGQIKGGSGLDTLVISLTTEEWLALAPTLQAELDAYLAFIAMVTNSTGQATGQLFSFASLGIEVKQFETLELVVDGTPISPEDDPVDAVDDAYSLLATGTAAGNVLDNDSVPDLVASVTLLDGPNMGTLTFGADGSFSFDPGSDFDYLAAGVTEEVTFTYMVTDANGDTDTATVTITVVGVNEDPVAANDFYNISEDAALAGYAVLANDTDVDVGDVLTITSVTADPGSGGSFSTDGAQVFFDPGAAYDSLAVGETATASATYTISDGNGGTSTATVTFTIEGVNDDPTAGDDYILVGEGQGAVVLPVSNNDSDPDASDTLEIVAISDAGLSGAFSLVNGEIVYDADAILGFLGAGENFEETITYTVSDGNGGTDTAEVTVRYTGLGPTEQSDATTDTLDNGQQVTVSLNGPLNSDDGTGAFTASIAATAVVQPKVNVMVVIDTSGSTGTGNIGTTVLDQEKAAVQALIDSIIAEGYPPGSVTITLMPFSGTSNPDQSGQTAFTFDPNNPSALASGEGYLGSLTATGTTNYVEAVQDAHTVLTNLAATTGPATNVVYFLSDGQPVPSNGQEVPQIEAAAAALQSIAQVSAFEIGNVNALQFLDAVDNTGGATPVSDPANDLTAALLEPPIPAGVLVDADVFVFDGGTQVAAVDYDPSDFTGTLTSLELDLGLLSDLPDELFETGRVEFVAAFDTDDDGTADQFISVDLDIMGY